MKERTINASLVAVSVAIPLLVLFLFYIKPPDITVGFDIRILPALNASINLTTALLLLTGFYFIRRKQIMNHRICMTSAVILSACFLVSYVIYHALSEPTSYGGTGRIRSIYYFILISHIILAALIVPLVLFTFARALQKRFDRHRRIARWTYPLWLYVTITGVVVYLMLRPYY